MKLEYRNSTGLMAVIGDPIGHSLSPLLQNTMLEALGEDYIYLALPVRAGELASFTAAAKALRFRGFNLTMPHKEDILPFLFSRTEEARRCGSVNSVRIRDGRLEGHSTDGLGFRRSLQAFGRDFPGRTVTLLGAGGAARAVAICAADSGAERVFVVNRTLSRAEALCAGAPNMTPLPLTGLAAVLPRTDILINATPVGMSGAGGGAAPSLEALQPGALCMDCVYAPALTPFMEEAKKWGHEAGNGIGMLVYQAIYALEFFLDRAFSPETVSDLGQRLLAVSGVDMRGGSQCAGM